MSHDDVHDRPDETDLDALAARAADATWGDDDTARPPGVLTGEVGPKGRVSASHRAMSRTARNGHGDVPPGTRAPGGGRYLVVALAAAVLLLLAAAALLMWAVG